MAFIKKRYIGWGVSLVLAWVLYKSITPPGGDPLHAEASALAMRGRNLYAYIQRAGEKQVGLAVAENCCSDDFLRSILEDPQKLGHLAFDEEGCLWNVLVCGKGFVVPDLPILISANFNPSVISRKGENELLPMGPPSGASRSMLLDRAVVVVRNDGVAQVIKAERLTRKTFLRGATNGVGRVEVLTPHGRESVSFNPSDER